jgi:hypothetical protein
MKDPRTIAEHYRRISDLAPDKRVIVHAVYSQWNLGDGPHNTGVVYSLWVNDPTDPDNVIATIAFATTPTDKAKQKELRIDITDKVQWNEIPILGAVGLFGIEAHIDKNLGEIFGEKSSSEVQMTTIVSGHVKMDDKYQTNLPVRFISDSWLIEKPK